MAGNVLIIGANGGVGEAVTRILLGNGYSVTATVSRPGKADGFRAAFSACRAVVPLDLGDAVGTGAQLRAVMANMSTLDAVIVCGAVAPFGPAETVSMDQMRSAMEINCFSNLAIYQATMPLLRKSHGRLILTSSYSGRGATPMMVPYIASKFALEGLADVLRQEAGQWGVKVILLQPGGIKTPMIERSRRDLSALISGLTPSEDALYGSMYRKMLARTEAARADDNFTAPQTVAEVVVDALQSQSPRSRYAIGPDAELLIRASKEKPDEEIDAMVMEMYRA